MKNDILTLSRSFLRDYCVHELSVLPNYGPQSLNLACRYCQKQYKQVAVLRRHEAQNHNHLDPLYSEITDSAISTATPISKDGVF